MLDKIKKFFKRRKSDEEQSITLKSQSETIPFEERMKHLENYFKRNSETNESFMPEFEAAKKINGIALKNNISKNDLQEIVQIFNETNLKPHYNGSAWFDLKMHIHSLVIRLGLTYKDLPNGNIELNDYPHIVQ